MHGCIEIPGEALAYHMWTKLKQPHTKTVLSMANGTAMREFPAESKRPRRFDNSIRNRKLTKVANTNKCTKRTQLVKVIFASNRVDIFILYDSLRHRTMTTCANNRTLVIPNEFDTAVRFPSLCCIFSPNNKAQK